MRPAPIISIHAPSASHIATNERQMLQDSPDSQSSKRRRVDAADEANATSYTPPSLADDHFGQSEHSMISDGASASHGLEMTDVTSHDGTQGANNMKRIRSDEDDNTTRESKRAKMVSSQGITEPVQARGPRRPITGAYARRRDCKADKVALYPHKKNLVMFWKTSCDYKLMQLSHYHKHHADEGPKMPCKEHGDCEHGGYSPVDLTKVVDRSSPARQAEADVTYHGLDTLSEQIEEASDFTYEPEEDESLWYGRQEPTVEELLSRRCLADMLIRRD